MSSFPTTETCSLTIICSGKWSHPVDRVKGTQIRGSKRATLANLCSSSGANATYKNLALQNRELVLDTGNVSNLPTKGLYIYFKRNL